MNVYVFRGNLDLSFLRVLPGQWVVLKPNLIKQSKENDPAEWRSVITSAELIEEVCDDVCRKLAGRGKVTICDAPQTDSSFVEIAQRLGLHAIAERCSKKHGVPVEVYDLRAEEAIREQGVIVRRTKLPGDPHGAIKFNLGRDSLFYGFAGEGHYYGADYDAAVTNRHHQGETHEYLISATPILCDVFINLPKMKTHKKTGVTLNLKNLVGINAEKNWLPHHTVGSPASGGDQFPSVGWLQRCEQLTVGWTRSLALKLPGIGTRLAQRLRRAGTGLFGSGQQVIRSGNWHGNDTTWRMALDLNRCLLYGNPDGTLRHDRPKAYYSLIDGRIGMEGAGPMQGDPIASNVVVGGTSPVEVDMVAARVMGFDWRKLNIIREAYKLTNMPIATCQPADVNVISDVPAWNGRFLDIEDRQFLHFRPHFGWTGAIEYTSKQA